MDTKQQIYINKREKQLIKKLRSYYKDIRYIEQNPEEPEKDQEEISDIKSDISRAKRKLNKVRHIYKHNRFVKKIKKEAKKVGEKYPKKWLKKIKYSRKSDNDSVTQDDPSLERDINKSVYNPKFITKGSREGDLAESLTIEDFGPEDNRIAHKAYYQKKRWILDQRRRAGDTTSMMSIEGRSAKIRYVMEYDLDDSIGRLSHIQKPKRSQSLDSTRSTERMIVENLDSLSNRNSADDEINGVNQITNMMRELNL